MLSHIKLSSSKIRPSVSSKLASTCFSFFFLTIGCTPYYALYSLCLAFLCLRVARCSFHCFSPFSSCSHASHLYFCHDPRFSALSSCQLRHIALRRSLSSSSLLDS